MMINVLLYRVLPVTQGCPVPDTDKDGINDEEDQCPTQAGPASNKGCPLVDSDGDGIPDPDDKCPNLFGTVENQGCPAIQADVAKKIDYAAQNIYFTYRSIHIAG